MNKNISTIAFAILISGCSDASVGGASLPTKTAEEFFNVTIASGVLAGEYTLETSQSAISQMNAGYDDDSNNTSISGMRLRSSDGTLPDIGVFRWINGELKEGINEPFENCLMIELHDKSNTNSWRRIDGEAVDCSTTSISGLGEWAENAPYRKRGVVGNFTEAVKFTVKNDDDTTSEFNSDITVEFGVIQKELVRK